jgi:pyrroline-5-carboxylate reductase
VFQETQITFIGGGAMGEAMIKAILAKELILPQQVTASDIRPDRCTELQKRYGIEVTTDNVAAVREADIVVMSIKPQVLPSVMVEIEGKIRPTALILSIAAGVRTSTLVQGLFHGAVIRSMPNTPAQIGEGMVVWTATDAVTHRQREQAGAILDSMGQSLYVKDEKQLDVATAVNGTGPAYVFLFLESMVDATVRLGFGRPVARQIVLQTVLGSVLLAKQSDLHLAELRNLITSPGGTTAEALYHMEESGFRATIQGAIMAAYQKSKDLAKGE